MSSKAITEKPEQTSAPGGWHLPPESAPSILRADEPTFARWVGLVGLLSVTLGSVALVAAAKQYASRIGPVTGTFFSVFGLACLLFHAARDADLQVRRTYGVLGYLWLVAGVLISALPIRGAAGSQFLPYGFTCLTLALLFLMPFARNETDQRWRQLTLTVLALVGSIQALTGFIGGSISENFLLPYSLLLNMLGLAYLWAFIVLQGTSTEQGYRAAVALAAVGVLFLLIALGRSALPPLFYALHWRGTRPESYLVPSGLLLTALGLLYGALGIGLSSDNRLVVLTRRELAAFFYSPIAYIVLLGMTVVALWVFYQFVVNLLPPPGLPEERTALREPILFNYVIGWFPIITTMFVVPILTMRLLSEEQRTGTLEVLFTAPVTETVVVLSKFLATFIFFMLAWVPTGLYLIALRVEGGQPFEYRPLLSFFIALACSGAGFVAMGLFFSSLTRNQIAAAILTFVGMLALTSLFFGLRFLEAQRMQTPGSDTTASWIAIFDLTSYVSLWITSMEGKLAPRQLVFHVSAAIFWLFLTVKVLESRKWR
jgi:ABC-type transport system involved in multi-copper enzyme maturation permease subunit